MMDDTTQRLTDGDGRPAIDRQSIETSVTTDSAKIHANDWDVEAHATDGTYTTLHRVTRGDDTTVTVDTYRCHNGTHEQVPGSPTTFEVEADLPTETFAKRIVEGDPELAVELAAEHFDGSRIGETVATDEEAE